MIVLQNLLLTLHLFDTLLSQKIDKGIENDFHRPVSFFKFAYLNSRFEMRFL